MKVWDGGKADRLSLWGQLVPHVGKWWIKCGDREQAKTRKRRDRGERCELERGRDSLFLIYRNKEQI